MLPCLYNVVKGGERGKVKKDKRQRVKLKTKALVLASERKREQADEEEVYRKVSGCLSATAVVSSFPKTSG